MGKIKFVPSHYWKKETMSLSDSPTPEQWEEVEKVANTLSEKYSEEPGCLFHPHGEQRIQIGLFNDFVDIQVLKADTCQCHDIVTKLLKIREDESAILNRSQ